MPLLLIWLLLIASPPVDYLVVTPKAFRSALEPLLRHREEQGLSVQVITLESLADKEGSSPAAERIKAGVKQVYEKGGKKLQYLLLVGDTGPGGVPTFLKEHHRWQEGDPELMATDVPYGDMEGDLLPEVAVGRLPVSHGPELTRVVGKILRFEAAFSGTPSRLTVALFGGVSGYAPVADRFLEGFARTLLDTQLPLTYTLRVVFANETSPYCPPPNRIGEAFRRFLEEGPLFSVFLCHASRRSCLGMYKKAVQTLEGNLRLETVRTYGFGMQDVAELDPKSTSGPCFLFTCLAGDFNDEKPCIAEALLLAEGGPVCVMGASCYSHPLPNLYLCQALLEEMDRHETMGKLMLAVKRKGLEQKNVLAEMLLRDVEGHLESEGPVDVKRLKRDHVLLYNLLGDPAVPLHRPRPLKVLASLSRDRREVTLAFRNPLPRAEGYAALFRSRTWAPPPKIPPDPEKETKAWTEAKEALFKSANHKCIHREPLAFDAGKATVRLKLEKVLPPGKYRAMVYLAKNGKDVAGAVRIEVKQPEKE